MYSPDTPLAASGALDAGSSSDGSSSDCACDEGSECDCEEEEELQAVLRSAAMAAASQTDPSLQATAGQASAAGSMSSPCGTAQHNHTTTSASASSDRQGSRVSQSPGSTGSSQVDLAVVMPNAAAAAEVGRPAVGATRQQLLSIKVSQHAFGGAVWSLLPGSPVS